MCQIKILQLNILPTNNKNNFTLIMIISSKANSQVPIFFLDTLYQTLLSFHPHRLFRRWSNIFTEFIPQVIFLMSLFGYLVALIFIKWFKFNGSNSDSAPSLIVMFIDMFMGPVFGRNAKVMYIGQVSSYSSNGSSLTAQTQTRLLVLLS